VTLVIVSAGVLGLLLAMIGGRLPRRVLVAGSQLPFLLCAGAVVRLGAAFVATDTRFTVVNEASRRNTSTMLRIAGLWGTARSSLLMWTFCGAIVTGVVGFGFLRNASDSFAAHRVRLLAATTGAFALLSALIANPFVQEKLPPIDGAGLSPILEHPAMLWHPPIMYAGLIATMLAWGHGLFPNADNIKKGDERLRTCLLVIVLLLGTALFLGALWAYDEQGWGGYWAWDPVENGGFLPWLSALTALHSLRRNRSTPTDPKRNGTVSKSTSRLTALAFFLTCLGSLTTRSGIMPSVHAFAEQRALGIGLLALSIAVAIGSVVVIGGSARRSTILGSSVRRSNDLPIRTRLRRVDSLFVAVTVSLAVLAIVTLGTYAPLTRYLANGTRTQTLGSYYARFVFPFVVVGMIAMATARLGSSKRQEVVTIGMLATVLAAGYSLRFSANVLSIVMFWFASVLTVAITIAAIRKRWSIGNALAHGGFALLLIGFAGSMATTHRTMLLPKGVAKTIGTLTLTNRGVTVIEKVANGDASTQSIRVEIIGAQHGDQFVLVPQLVGYPARRVIFSKTAIERGFLNDVHISLRRAADNQLATIELHDRPLTSFIWLGSFTMLLGVAVLFGKRQSTS
jgi:c-type cytochrome biogenesis protein CcmF